MIYVASAVAVLLVIVIAVGKRAKPVNGDPVGRENRVETLWDDQPRSDCTKEILDKWEANDYGDIAFDDALASYRHVQDFFNTIDRCQPKDVWVAYKKCCKAWSVLRSSPEHKPQCKRLLRSLRYRIEDEGNLYVSKARQATRIGQYTTAKYADAMEALLAYSELMDLEDDNIRSGLRKLYMKIYVPLKDSIHK